MKQPTWRRGLSLGVAVAAGTPGVVLPGFLHGTGTGVLVLLLNGRGRSRRSQPAWRERSWRPWFSPWSAARLLLSGVDKLFPIADRTSISIGHWSETWVYGSELWKYVVPKNSWLAANYFRDLRHKVPAPIMDEGWNFPGYTVASRGAHRRHRDGFAGRGSAKDLTRSWRSAWG